MNLKCDFCSDPNPTWRYPASSFISLQTEKLVSESVGDWAACIVCHDLIQLNDIEGLINRSMETGLPFSDINIFGTAADLVDATIRKDLRRLFLKFFKQRIGPAVRIEE